MAIDEKKRRKLVKRMEELGIREEELNEKFILSSGKGGQKLQKTSSCVYLKHPPSGIAVKRGKERSRELNRFLARRALCDKVEELLRQKETTQKRAEAKIRKQKKRRSRRLRQKILEEKRAHSRKKELRKTPLPDDTQCND